jgi:predicted Zn-dependent protease
MNKKTYFVLILSTLLIMLVAACSQVAITGRKQLNLIPAPLINSMSFSNYSQFLSENKLSSDVQRSQMVKRVGQRIQRSVEKYCAQNGMSDILRGYQWDFNLIEDDQVNAWAMPGGKVVVYTGLLKVARDETGLAVVMGHEIAHAVAKHGGERMTQGLLVELGAQSLAAALEEKPAETQELFMKSYGLGTEIGVLLPYSRVHEKEADHMGLIFMAMAGYNPTEAVSFWQRMAEAGKDKGYVPEILSTHPADSTRIRNIQNLLPEAMKYYKTAE